MIRLVPLMCLLACTRTAGSFSLEDGTEISVGDDGSIALVIDGAETFALSDRPPQVRTFDESSEGPFAIWSFERDDERRVPLNLDRVRRDGEQVLVDYVSAGSRTATLAIEATEAGTRFTFAVEGDEADSIAIPVRCDEGGSFHGFGEQYSTTNLKGESFRLLLEEQGVGRQEDGFRPVSGDRFTTYFPMP